MAGPTQVAILADDLIWATRLRSIVTVAGAEAQVASSAGGFAALLAEARAAIVDLSARRSDPFEAIAAATRAGVGVMAVGPHEDAAARRRALAAGASRVLPYRRLATDGPSVIAAWLGLERPAPAAAPVAARPAPAPGPVASAPVAWAPASVGASEVDS